MMKLFWKRKDEGDKSLDDLLREARAFIATRGTYYYGHDRKGPGADLVERIDQFLKRSKLN